MDGWSDGRLVGCRGVLHTPGHRVYAINPYPYVIAGFSLRRATRTNRGTIRYTARVRYSNERRTRAHRDRGTVRHTARLRLYNKFLPN